MREPLNRWVDYWQFRHPIAIAVTCQRFFTAKFMVSDASKTRKWQYQRERETHTTFLISGELIAKTNIYIKYVSLKRSPKNETSTAKLFSASTEILLIAIELERNLAAMLAKCALSLWLLVREIRPKHYKLIQFGWRWRRRWRRQQLLYATVGPCQFQSSWSNTRRRWQGKCAKLECGFLFLWNENFSPMVWIYDIYS